MTIIIKIDRPPTEYEVLDAVYKNYRTWAQAGGARAELYALNRQYLDNPRDYDASEERAQAYARHWYEAEAAAAANGEPPPPDPVERLELVRKVSAVFTKQLAEIEATRRTTAIEKKEDEMNTNPWIGIKGADALRKVRIENPDLLRSPRNLGSVTQTRPITKGSLARQEFDLLVAGIVARDKVNRMEAMRRARREHPKEFAALQTA